MLRKLEPRCNAKNAMPAFRRASRNNYKLLERSTTISWF